jgi:hypothetical protein
MGLRRKLQKLTKTRDVDTPWMSSMTDKYTRPPSSRPDGGDDDAAPQLTVAAFSPNQQTASKTRNRSSVLIHQKSPLLVATPPQVTRALAYSHPFILPLNHVVGLLTWTTGDAWESFLLLSAFWFLVLYGDDVVRWAGPLVVVVGLIFVMYTRRYSPLSSTTWTGAKAKRKRADSEQRKTLDEILETLQVFTQRCDVLLDPFLRLTEFLSTQSSATSATTRPALTSLFIRILAVTPIWIVLSLPPWRIITTKRVVLAIGTLSFSWHSRSARVTRTILWRSKTVRSIATLVTGLTFSGPQRRTSTRPGFPPRNGTVKPSSIAGNAKPGVRFTFTVYENQRRWLGLGWTASLLAYERQAWTDEHMNTCEDPEHFELPDTDHDTTKWRWVAGSEWRVEGATTDKEKSAKRIGGGGGGDDSGWTYYDNKWQSGSKVDGWDRYTRRRKWIRDAELVDADADDDAADPPNAKADHTAVADPESGDAASITSTAKRKGWFGGTKKPRRATNEKPLSDAGSGKAGSAGSVRSRDDSEDDVHTPMRYRNFDWDRSIGEGVYEGLS